MIDFKTVHIEHALRYAKKQAKYLKPLQKNLASQSLYMRAVFLCKWKKGSLFL